MQQKKRERTIGDASKLKVGIAVARYNGEITDALLQAAKKELEAWKVKPSNIQIIRVHGSYDLPIACHRLIKKYKRHAVIALGCIIKGETDHDAYIAQAVFNSLSLLSIETGVPVGLGILTVRSLTQAKDRITYGASAAEAALEAALL